LLINVQHHVIGLIGEKTWRSRLRTTSDRHLPLRLSQTARAGKRTLEQRVIAAHKHCMMLLIAAQAASRAKVNFDEP